MRVHKKRAHRANTISSTSVELLFILWCCFVHMERTGKKTKSAIEIFSRVSTADSDRHLAEWVYMSCLMMLYTKGCGRWRRTNSPNTSNCDFFHASSRRRKGICLVHPPNSVLTSFVLLFFPLSSCYPLAFDTFSWYILYYFCVFPFLSHHRWWPIIWTNIISEMQERDARLYNKHKADRHTDRIRDTHQDKEDDGDAHDDNDDDDGIWTKCIEVRCVG